MADPEPGEQLELVRRPMPEIQRPGAPHLERVASRADVLEVKLRAPLHQAAHRPRPALAEGDAGLGVAVLRRALAGLGYGLETRGDFDSATALTVTAFQRHWRPARIDGIADGETRARLMALLRLI